MRGRPILGVIAGFFFGVFLSATLVLGDVLALNSVLVTVIPGLGVLYGLGLGLLAPFGRGRARRADTPTF